MNERELRYLREDNAVHLDAFGVVALSARALLRTKRITDPKEKSALTKFVRKFNALRASLSKEKREKLDYDIHLSNLSYRLTQCCSWSQATRTKFLFDDMSWSDLSARMEQHYYGRDRTVGTYLD
jgi:hypothetical protein